jgi:hypothetical protein
VWHGGRDLLSCRSAAGSWRRAALPPKPNSCRRAPWRQELNAVGYDARCTFLENFDSDPLVFENQAKINIKKFPNQIGWVGLAGPSSIGPGPFETHPTGN